MCQDLRLEAELADGLAVGAGLLEGLSWILVLVAMSTYRRADRGSQFDIFDAKVAEGCSAAERWSESGQKV